MRNQTNPEDMDKKKLAIELHDLAHRGALILYCEAIDVGKLSKDQKSKIESVDGYAKFRREGLPILHSYQPWFTIAARAVKQILPERYDEFCHMYRSDKRSNQRIDSLSYTISDYIHNITPSRGGRPLFDTYGAMYTKFETQKSILNACIQTLPSRLADIEGVLLYKVFESELEAAGDLLKKKYIRAAGALAGVTLEIHLSKVCASHNLKFRSKNPTISKFNEALQKAGVVDTPTWRLIARLGDIRNMCVHSKDREPTTDEIQDLINGSKKLIAELE